MSADDYIKIQFKAWCSAITAAIFGWLFYDMVGNNRWAWPCLAAAVIYAAFAWLYQTELMKDDERRNRK